MNLKASDFTKNNTGVLATVKMSKNFNYKLDEIIKGVENGRQKNSANVVKAVAKLKKIRRNSAKMEQALSTGKTSNTSYMSERIKYYYSIVAAVLGICFAMGLTSLTMALFSRPTYNPVDYLYEPIIDTVKGIWTVFAFLALFTVIHRLMRNFFKARKNLKNSKLQDPTRYSKILDKAVKKVNKVMGELEKKTKSEAEGVDAVERGIKIMGATPELINSSH